ncbi:MAG: anhydro-N-acetylmuramic acid kinase [Gemmatimonadales bacterium]
MTAQTSLAVGIMSGTSLDGVDAALIRIAGDGVELVRFVSRPYADSERDEILRSISGHPVSTPELARLHVHLAEWAAQAVDMVLADARVGPAQLAFIAYPGQTMWHEPPVVSWQIGEPAILAERFGVQIVSGFRARDVAAGGQGAPLVPMADALLFGARESPRILLNLGGMSNLTWVEQRGRLESVVAFDAGPGVAIIDEIARLVSPELPYDVEGRLAAQGQPDQAILTELLADPFFSTPPPKSTGRERFGQHYARRLHERLPGADGVATAVALTARSVVQAIGAWLPPAPELVASGGGTHHPGLMQAIADGVARIPGGTALRRFDELFFPGDAKEAVAFAFLGHLMLTGQPGNLPAATGARGFRFLGSVTPA